MSLQTIQNSFASGEISPSLYGRTDLGKWHQGAFTLRNFFVNYRGGASSRAGLGYVGTCMQSGDAAPPRDIPFQFSLAQGYVLEFGDQYLRIKTDGGYVLEAPLTISAITKANPGVLTVTANNFSNGDWIFISGGIGMTEFNGLVWIVASRAGNNITLTDLFGNTVDTTNFPTYIGNSASASRLYTVNTPYAAVDLPYLKYTQSADTMTLCCVNTATLTEYPAYELQRQGNTNWVLTQVNLGAVIAAPAGAAATAVSTAEPTTWYSYVVTAIDLNTGSESVASNVVTVQNNDISAFAGSNVITWTAVAGASAYNVYKATPSYLFPVGAGALYGFMGTALGTSIVDDNIVPDFTSVPPVHNDPFARGAIIGVTPGNAGTNYSQSNITFSVTTVHGSGLVGTPIVVNGGVVGFLIQDGGSGYLTGDTIHFTSVAGGVAKGSLTFAANPADSTNIVLNGVTIAFKTSPTAGAINQVQLGGTLADTMLNLVVFLAAVSSASLGVASYTISGGNKLNITFLTSGAGGNAYTLSGGTSGATPSAATLTGGGVNGANATATLVVGPASGTYPGSVAYFDERRVYAATLNNPDTYFMSQPGSFDNYDSSIPVTDSDAVTGTPWAQQVNGIQFMVPMPGGLIVLTGKGAWQVNGGAPGVAITPSSQNANPQAYNGCNATVPPITINYDILYVQAKGSIVRDLSYNFYVNIYTGTDITVLSSHLFSDHTITAWAWAEEPYKVVWAIRDDGTLLSLTYLKEQDVCGWARHDTNGLFVSVCSITEPPVDAVYVIVKRFVRGQWMYYSERMDDRNWATVEQCVCSDASLQLPQNMPNATIQMSASSGSANISSTLVTNGGSGYVNPLVEVQDPTGEGSGATFNVTVVSGVITAITPVSQGQNYSSQTALIITDTAGTGAAATPVITNYVNVTANANAFTAKIAHVGDVLRGGGGVGTVVTVTDTRHITIDMEIPMTSVVPDDPNETPIPLGPGLWSIATPATSISGLNHLEGLEVCILADGGVVSNQTVVGGAVTLTVPASAVTIGLPYLPQLQTPYLDPPGPTTSQTRRKNIYSVGVRVEASRGMQIGSNQPDASAQPNGEVIEWKNMKQFKQRNATIGAGRAIPLFTGDEFINIPADWSTKGQVAIEQPYPLPANILAVVPYHIEGDTPG